jgi:hypothetical protein
MGEVQFLPGKEELVGAVALDDDPDDGKERLQSNTYWTTSNWKIQSQLLIEFQVTSTKTNNPIIVIQQIPDTAAEIRTRLLIIKVIAPNKVAKGSINPIQRRNR